MSGITINYSANYNSSSSAAVDGAAVARPLNHAALGMCDSLRNKDVTNSHYNSLQFTVR